MRVIVFFVVNIIIFGSSLTHGLAQEIVVRANLKPLSDVLLQLRNDHGLQISFDHQLASACLVVRNKTYKNTSEAIADLIADCDLAYEYIDGVYVIFQKKKIDPLPKAKEEFYYSGQLIDSASAEPLPFSTIQLDQGTLTADANGFFTFKADQSVQQFKVSHVGYFQLDTLIQPGHNMRIQLAPSILDLEEIVIKPRAQIYDVHVGEKSGLIKLNAKVASFLPGDNSNSLYNLLRLQPGILASGERSGDYIIWGNHKGHNLLTFDGIPLFNTVSQNNEIGIINPLMIQDVEVYKGGYQVDQGDRVGSVINITGKSGSNRGFGGEVNLNSQTASVRLNVPISRSMVLQTSLRKSYYNIVDWNKLVTKNADQATDFFSRDFDFADLHLKLSGRYKNGDHFYASFLGNHDDSSFNIEDVKKLKGKAWENKKQDKVVGGSIFYSKNWQRWGRTNLMLSFSSLNSLIVDVEHEDKESGDSERDYQKQFQRQNSVSERTLKVSHQFPKVGMNSIDVGLNVITNNFSFKQQENDESVEEKSNDVRRVGGYVKDNVSLGQYANLIAGLKLDYLFNQQKTFVMPRLNLLVHPHPNWKLNVAWGLYNQYITQTTLLDNIGNRFFVWVGNNGRLFPVVQARHHVINVSYNKQNTNISLEGFYKTVDGIGQYSVRKPNNRDGSFMKGTSRIYGLEFYASQKIGNHDIWASYTISRVEDKFQMPPNQDYHRAPQDQTHEIKVVSLLNFNPWHVSMNYVYGSGLEITSGLGEIIPYSRFDAAFLYAFSIKKVKVESGLSLVNIFNSKNVAFSGFSTLRNGKKVFSKGVPFTPSIFFNVSF